jgi:hypothetical protein
MNEMIELPSVEEISRFVESLLPVPYVGPERRRAPRRSVLIPVRIRALDDRLQGLSEEEDALLCNVSCLGAMFIHQQELTARFVALSFPDRYPAGELVLEIVRNRPVGSYFEIAGTFVSSEHGTIASTVADS